jgi:hypothetical protein
MIRLAAIRRGAILGLLLFAATFLGASEVLDGIAVAVNGHVILRSDWQDEVRYEFFVAAKPLQGITLEDRKGALDRLIDQELLREQTGTSEVRPASPEEIEKQYEIVKADYGRDHGALTWSAVLVSYHLTEADIKNHIALELSQLRLVDAHFRPSIQVDAAAIADYYRDHMAPHPAGGQRISLKEATPKIRELLTQEKMNQLLGPWLESLRSQAQIKIFAADSPETQGQQ